MIAPAAPTGGPQPPEQAETRARMKAAAQAFEAVFLRQLIGSMRQANLGEDILGNSASDQFRELSDAKLADQMATTGNFGIAEMLLRQFEGGDKR